MQLHFVDALDKVDQSCSLKIHSSTMFSCAFYVLTIGFFGYFIEQVFTNNIFPSNNIPEEVLY